MEYPGIKKTRRHLPHWSRDGSTYFITFRLRRGELTADERQITLDHIRNGDGRYYRLHAAVVMPDHVHLLGQPAPGMTLARIMKGIKGVSARLINQYRGTVGRVWQDESHDRMMRDADELEDKTAYLLDNPRRAGLVETIDAYPFWYRRPAE